MPARRPPGRRKPLATLLALLTSASSAAVIAAPAARVDFATGEVLATSTDGQRRPLAKGSDVMQGDTVVTNRTGRVHLRFTDGGYISLKPNTEFRVDEYRFEGEEDEESRSLFSLLKGGLRSITGLVAKVKQDNYRLRTPVATIGIRGTIFEAEFSNPLTARVIDGEIALFGEDGTLLGTVGEGEEVTYDSATGIFTINGQVVEAGDEEAARRLSDLLDDDGDDSLPLFGDLGEDVDGMGMPTILEMMEEMEMDMNGES